MNKKGQVMYLYNTLESAEKAFKRGKAACEGLGYSYEISDVHRCLEGGKTVIYYRSTDDIAGVKGQSFDSVVVMETLSSGSIFQYIEIKDERFL